MTLKKYDWYQCVKSDIKELLQLRDIKIMRYRELTLDDVKGLYEKYTQLVIRYMQKKEIQGFYSVSSTQPSVYSYIYWIMTAGLLDVQIDDGTIEQLRKKLLECQAEDGLCWDYNIINLQYLNGDGWGARHLIPQYLIALERLKIKPIYKLTYLSTFYSKQMMEVFLESLDWTQPWQASNVVMNIGVGLFYERDYLKNPRAEVGIKAMQNWMLANIRSDCGMWGSGSIKSKTFKYALIRGAYHMFSFLIYDNIDFPYKEKAIDLIMECQNKYGGYDFRKNSSACEDIDAIEPLIRLSIILPNYRRQEVIESTKKAFFWVIQNQMKDGGCVFRLGEKHMYGCSNMQSGINESNAFATWFRTLSICYMYDFLTGNERNYINLPGYEYPILGRKNEN